ncbi:MAG: 4-hydroxybenzoate octaprenyltransferase [Gammaproteobacteria bacterium]|jgi:4-hydroxybenzoate polyprenyltransferase|nr:4-hydroxybenzoate octaprenyltransferase [Gammaproteobacteria bacterium]MBT3724359.1 4-hydroxybenzoate octaprenyltransferase [Gammaproteobacteria bacterium]MBT4194044.1 4-hydroxybenzoate octaprenyltransferase [Gammaproteobacteria bacterium]MBT4452063.1 4-hydroxybenzoate octaprenyltransferase [Gammaproteobacteria bacterium]MBT4861068.1 4-hydroxybenzoate octaprenyltransferase [Gammaproteobacteria bacterium]
MNSFYFQKLKLYSELVRLERPIGIYLLLWPTLWALAIAGEGGPDLWVLFVFVTGVVLMRSAGCAINDYADRHIDLHVARTKDRPLTSGKISSKEALMVFAVLSILAFMLVLTLNTYTIYLSVGGIILAASYPFMKRYHYLPQVHLGAAFGWAVPMAYAAQTGSMTKIAWLLYVATLLWTVAYDTMYAMVDRDDDLKIGAKSTAILFGDADRVIIGFLQLIFIVTLWLIGQELEFSIIYFIGLVFALLLLAYEQAMIVYRLPEFCFQAFLHNHWVGAVVFFCIMGHYYLS